MAEVLDIEEEKIIGEVEKLQEEYKKDNRGFRIISDDKEAEMVSAPENKEIAQSLFRSDVQEELSRAALETLAVIIYKGPINKTGIEEIRGVNCSFTLRSLMVRGLVEKSGKGEYKISLELLKKFGIENAGELLNC